MAANTGPLTPAKSLASSRPGSKLQDSPFSDYFTDDGRSSNEYGYTAPSPEAHKMLLRLNKLQSQVMRGADGESEREALGIIGKRLDSIELDLNSLHSQTRMPPEMEDSGLFLEEEEDGGEDEKSTTPSGLGVQYDGANDAFEEQPTKEQKQAEYDYLAVQAQQVLSNVMKANDKLRMRWAELRDLNDVHTMDMEEKDRQIEELKSENEGMQLDLNHDHSELLFLKLQFKALEVEVDALEDDTPSRPEPAQRKKLQEDMDRWRSDWDNVDGRMKKRRSKYGVASPQSRRDSIAESSAESVEDDEWQLRTVKKGQGRVQSIVIQRTTSDGFAFDLDGADDVENEMATRSATTEGSTRNVSPAPKGVYADHSTQTESVPLSWLDGDDEETATPPLDEDDCAITTSSEDDETEYGDAAVEDDVEQPPVKSAWQDLWDGLSSFAGMGEEMW